MSTVKKKDEKQQQQQTGQSEQLAAGTISVILFFLLQCKSKESSWQMFWFVTAGFHLSCRKRAQLMIKVGCMWPVKCKVVLEFFRPLSMCSSCALSPGGSVKNMWDNWSLKLAPEVKYCFCLCCCSLSITTCFSTSQYIYFLEACMQVHPCWLHIHNPSCLSYLCSQHSYFNSGNWELL